jgi:LCCL domain-containing protein
MRVEIFKIAPIPRAPGRREVPMPIFRSLLIAVSMFLLSHAPVAAQSDTCPGNALGLDDVLQCTCPANGPDGPIWGTSVYTADSNICTAARHSGVIGAAGGRISLTLFEGLESYTPSTANGITSAPWGSYNLSFAILAGTPAPAEAANPPCSGMPSGVAQYVCTCQSGAASGTVWGNGPYTDDSNICSAATHAGIIGGSGGNVRVLAAPGLQSYRGSAWNGITTRDFGSWGRSITFDRN